MHRRNRKWGCIAVGAGLLIFFALVVPEKVWWFILAAALVYLGIWYLRCY